VQPPHHLRRQLFLAQNGSTERKQSDVGHLCRVKADAGGELNQMLRRHLIMGKNAENEKVRTEALIHLSTTSLPRSGKTLMAPN
jgi:hypothetical protein